MPSALDALFLAATTGRTGRALSRPANQLNLQPQALGNALCLAACENRLETVRQLVELGADVNHRLTPGIITIGPDGYDMHGSTPLLLAVTSHEGDVLPIITELVRLGASVEGTEAVSVLGIEISPAGTSPLKAALNVRALDRARRLLELGARATPGAIHTAVLMGWEDAVGLLLEFGADPRASVAPGQTMLHMAVLANHQGIVRKLAAAGADVADVREPRLMSVAVKSSKDPGMVRTLVELGADPNQADEGIAPLLLAVEMDDLEMFDALLSAGARPGATGIRIEDFLVRHTGSMRDAMLRRLRRQRRDTKDCANCGKLDPSLQRCSGCKLVCYCSRECQNEHWRLSHRVACPVLKQVWQ